MLQAMLVQLAGKHAEHTTLLDNRLAQPILRDVARAVDLIDWPEGFARRDIGWRAVARERS